MDPLNDNDDDDDDDDDWPNSKFIALPVPEIIAIGVLGVVRTPILGKGRP